MSGSRFAYGFEYAEKVDSEIAKIGFRGLTETAENRIFFLLEFSLNNYVF
jgi:hypothetical protein